MRRLRRALLGAVGVAVLLVATAVPASAHAQLESSDPSQSSVLLVPPTQVVLHFDEPVEIDFGSLRVLGPGGRRVDNGGTHHPTGDSHAVAIPLPAHLARGTYVVAWRVISADSHPVHGAFVFSIGTASGARHADRVASTLADQSGSPVVGAVYWLVRFAAFVGLLFLVGSAVMVSVAWREGATSRRVGRLLWASWWLLLVATILGIAVQGVYAASLPLGDVIRPSLTDAVLHTRFGKVEALRILLLLACVPVLLGIRDRIAGGPARWRWVAPTGLVLAVALLFTPGLAGHASTGDQPGVGLALDVVHLAAASAWLGGLALLATFLVGRADRTERPDDPVGVTRTVSAVAFAAVAVIVGTGTYQSIRQVGSVYALFHTSYGRTLLVKILLVVVLVGAGALSRRIVHNGWRLRAPARGRVPGDGDGDGDGRELQLVPAPVVERSSAVATGVVASRRPTSAGGVPDEPEPGVGPEETVQLRRLRRSVVAELGIALAVLAVTAVLVNAVPAKQAAALPFSTSFTTLGVQVNAIVDPARAGTANEIHVYVLSGLGTPKAIPELDVTLSLPAEQLGPLTVPLAIAGPGHYYASHVDIPVAGDWILRFTVRTDAIDEQVVSVPLPVH